MKNFNIKKYNIDSAVKSQVVLAIAIFIAIFLFSILSLFAVAFYSDGGNESVGEGENTTTQSIVNNEIEDEIISQENLASIYDLIEDNHELTRRDNLNDKGKEIYDQLYEATKNRTEFVYIDDREYSEERSDELSNIFVNMLSLFVLTDHPELFWTNGGLLVNCRVTNSGTEYSYSVLSDCEESNIDKYNLKIKQKAEEIIKIMPDGSDYEKALWVHDYIVENTTYNNDVSWFVGKEESFSASIYSLLLKNESNCNGYSKTYKYLMDMLNIPCTVVVGTCNDGVLHAWNIIEIDGEYYQVDTTWDDPLGVNQAVHHNYFCITDEEMYKSRTLESAVSAPVCTSTKYNYHVCNNLYASEINEDVFSNAVDFYLNNSEDQVEVKFSTIDLTIQAEKYINSDNSFREMLMKKGFEFDTQISYSKYDDTNVIEITIE